MYVWPSGRAQQFILTRIDSNSRYGFAFSYPQNLDSIMICGFIEYLFKSHEIPNNIAPNAEIYFTVKKVQEWVHDHGIHEFYLVTHNPEATGLTGFLCLFWVPLLFLFYRVYLHQIPCISNSVLVSASPRPQTNTGSVGGSLMIS